MIVTALKGAYYAAMVDLYYREREAPGDTPAKRLNFQDWLDARETRDSATSNADEIGNE